MKKFPPEPILGSAEELLKKKVGGVWPYDWPKK